MLRYIEINYKFNGVKKKYTHLKESVFQILDLCKKEKDNINW